MVFSNRREKLFLTGGVCDILFDGMTVDIVKSLKDSLSDFAFNVDGIQHVFGFMHGVGGFSAFL